MSTQGDLMAEQEKWDALAWMGEAEWKETYGEKDWYNGHREA